MQPIKTKWHKLVSLVEDGLVYLTAPANSDGVTLSTGTADPWGDFNPDKNAARWMIKQFSDLPKFVVESDLLELVMPAGFEHSLLDMKKAGLFRLPFPAMIVEFNFKGVYYVVMLRDQAVGTPFPWEAESGVVKSSDAEIMPFYGIVFRVDADEDGQYVVLSPSVQGISLEDRDGSPWIAISAQGLHIFPPSERLDKLVKQTWLKDGAAIYRAVATAMLVMHTEGVKREVVDCSKMNKKRVASNKIPIPRHIVLSIGKVYRSASSNVADAYNPRKSPRPHWRRGHLRNVRFGPNRASIKEVYINPKLVAYKEFPGSEPPKPSQEYMVVYRIESNNGVTTGPYKTRAAAQKAADRCNAEAPGQGWHPIKR